jgi:hypothetical protein
MGKSISGAGVLLNSHLLYLGRGEKFQPMKLWGGVADRKLFVSAPARTLKNFGSGSGNSFGTTCYHRFYIKKWIFHVFDERILT